MVQRKEDGSFRSAFWNILVLFLLRVRQVVILLETGHICVELSLRSRTNDSNSSTSNIIEPNMETTEFGTNDEGHSKWCDLVVLLAKP
eukprot:17893_4